MNKKTCQTDLLKMVTCQAPVNIAVIKYCKNKRLILKALFISFILKIDFSCRG